MKILELELEQNLRSSLDIEIATNLLSEKEVRI